MNAYEDSDQPFNWGMFPHGFKDWTCIQPDCDGEHHYYKLTL